MDLIAPVGSNDPTTWVNGDRAAGIKGSRVPFEAFTNANAEIVNAISQSGLTPDQSDLTQLYQAIKSIGATNWRLEDIAIDSTASVDDHRTLFHCSESLQLTLPNPAAAGNQWMIWVRNRSTGNVTLNPTAGTINGLTTMPLRKGHGGYIFSDGANYRLIRTETPRIVTNANCMAIPHASYANTTMSFSAAFVNELGLDWNASAPSVFGIPSDLKRISVFLRGSWQNHATGYRDVFLNISGVPVPDWHRSQGVDNGTALPTWHSPPFKVTDANNLTFVQRHGAPVALVNDTNAAMTVIGEEWV